MPDPDEFSKEIAEDRKNLRTVQCKYCSSVILEPSTGSYVDLEFALPLITQKVEATTPATETLRSFWEVTDMFAFYNIGFSNTVENTKFLTCADCDVGPIGYHDLTTKKSFVALTRVQHK